MINKESKKQKLYAQVVQKAWESSEFKKNLIANPVETIEKLTGSKITIPNGKTLVVMDEADTANNKPESDKSYLIIPDSTRELTEEELESVAGGLTITITYSQKDGWEFSLELNIL